MGLGLLGGNGPAGGQDGGGQLMVQLVFLHLGVGLGLQLLHDLLGGDHLGGLVVIQGLVHRRGQRVGQIQLAHGNGRLLDDGDFLRRGSRLLKHRGF